MKTTSQPIQTKVKPKFTIQPLKPYQYQQDLIKETLMKLKTSKRKSVFTVSPPGSGKTLMMACLAKLFTKNHWKVLAIAHRTEIIQQLRNTFLKQGVDPHYFKAVMVNTLANHLNVFTQVKPDVIFTDEAHHSVSKTYLKIYQYFKDAYKLFFTATPWRGDGKGFEQVADNKDMILGPSVDWLIQHHKLAPFKYYSNVLVDKSKLKVSKRTGDYTQASINKQTRLINVNEMIKMYQKIGDNKQGIIYASSVEQSKKITQAFNAAGIKTVHLDGASDSKQREQWLQEYREGKIQMISNVQIFTEGVDLPNACVALIARPTKSLSLYFQFSMRVLRYQPHKIAKIIDFSGVANELGLPNRKFEWTLLSRDVTKKQKPQKSLLTCPNCHTMNKLKNCILTIGTDPMDKEDDTKGTIVTCPECNHFIKFIPHLTWETNQEQALDYLDKQQQHLNHLKWLKSAKLSRNQGLQTNTEILQAQQPELNVNDIIIKLVKLYIPNWKKTDDPEIVLNSNLDKQDFSDDTIIKMYQQLKAKPNIDKFKHLYSSRGKIALKNYIQKADITHINNPDIFQKLFKAKIALFKDNAKIFSMNADKNTIINTLGENIINSIPKTAFADKKRLIKQTIIDIAKQNLLNKAELTTLLNKFKQESLL